MIKPLHKILTIDDENDIRMVASMVLKKKGGFEVISKSSGQDALDYLDSIPDDDLPDLIILDVMMPKMDGPQTLGAIKSKAPRLVANIPVIFMTAKCQPEEIKRLIGLGAVNVIPKPFDATKLADHVLEIWENI